MLPSTQHSILYEKHFKIGNRSIRAHRRTLSHAVCQARSSTCAHVKKNSGDARFVTDYRKLNLLVQRHPYPLLYAKEDLRKMEGFLHATCLGKSVGYCHNLLDKESQETCSIVLLLENVVTLGYLRVSTTPLTCFKKIDAIFSDNESVFYHFHSILLVMSTGFDDHLQQLDEVLLRLRNHNAQDHIEENFLAVKYFDYLWCRLAPDGIKPQEKKINGILRITQPSNLRELRWFVGFAQYCRDMFRLRSHVLHPLAS